ncbi:hypothetical protein G9A89_011499 [Geosiphon pyriformis]|nr:hypothetical protein G9A89_011499 [Geosiphon pyriformis]
METIQQNNFKVAITPDATTLEYYQSIYTHCKQRFNIPDGIEVVKKSVYQYIENCINNYFFGNYNISEVRNNLYNNLVHYSQLETEDLNSETLATYFQELNFNIIKYCEETYPVQSQYFIDFESETETSNKGKQKLKQYSKTTPNTPILPKTTVKHLQTPEQGTSSKLPLTITPFPASLAQAQILNSSLNRFARLEDFTLPRSLTKQQEPLQTNSNLLDFLAKNRSEHSETAVNKENDSEISEEESIDSENEEDKMTAYITKISEFNGEDIETITKTGDANRWNADRMLRTIPYFLKGTAAFKTAFLEQFTNNNTLITLRNCFCNIKQEPSKSVCPHAPEDLNSAIQHAKRYEMAMEEANCTKLVNLAIGETSSAAEEKIDQLAMKVKNYFTNQQQQQPQRYQPPQRQNQNNFTSPSNNQLQNQQNRSNQCYPLPQQSYYQLLLPPIQQQYQQPPTQHYQPRPTHYHTQPSYLTIPEEQNFYHTALLEGRAVAQQQNPSYIPTTILPARIAENANLSDIFPFEFEANKLPFLLSNAAANEQKAITAMYTEAEVEGKAIRLILNSRSAGSIITYQLMQQLKRNTPVGEIDNFPFTLDEITIPVKVLVMNTLQYQALIPATCSTFNKHSEKAPAFEFELEEEKPIIETFMALGSISNWADETEQQYFSTNNSLETKEPVTTRWNVSYSKPEPRKQCLYIPLKCKDCHKKLSSMGACISPEEEYENHTCYYCKACHRKRWGHLIKKSGKWDNTSCLTCGDMLPEECNWIDIAIKGGVCDQTCQYALSISEKVKRGTPFNAAYNSALNKLYHYPHDAEMIFDLAMALINGATKEDVHQMKEAEYIEYTMELAGFDYENEVKVYHQIASYTYPTQEAQI